MAAARPAFGSLLSQLAAEFEHVMEENTQLHAKLEGKGFSAARDDVQQASVTQNDHRSSKNHFHIVADAEYISSSERPSIAMPTEYMSDRPAVPRPTEYVSEMSGRPSGRAAQLAILAAPTLHRLGSTERVSQRSSEPFTRMRGSSVKRQSSQPDAPSASDIRKSRSFLNRGVVINPETSVFLHRWDRIVLWATLYVMLVTPVEVALLTLRPVVDPLFVFNTIVDIVFFTDMLLYFCIMYPKPTEHGNEWECRPKAIAVKYLKTWFLVDAISLTPVRSVAFFFVDDANQRTQKKISAFRMLRLIRALRLPRLIGRFQLQMSITYKEISLVKFFVILLILAHWLSCLWAFTLFVVGEKDGVPRWIDSIDELEVNVVAKTKSHPWKLYVACFYFTCYTMSSIGYGDIGPKNIVERLVCIFMVIISGVVWAIVLGQVSSILANMDHNGEAFRAVMDDLQLMMRDRKMGSDMRQRLRDFFTANKTAQRRARHGRLLETLSPGLHGEVSLELNREWVARVSFLSSILHKAAEHEGAPLRAFLADVSSVMQSLVYAQSETFGVPHVLYVLNCGLVGRESRILRSGAVWGVDFVLSDPVLVDARQSFAFTYVETLSLGREAFFQVIEAHRKKCPDVKRQIRRVICWLAFQRTIIQEARRRKRSQSRILRRDTVVSDEEDQCSSRKDADDSSQVSSREDHWEVAATLPLSLERIVV